jgi:predicted DNA-binding transcriptional regulator AlpA
MREDERFLTSPEVASRLGISERGLTRLRADGGGPPFVRIGRRVAYNPASLAEWIQRQEREGSATPGSSQ